MELKQFKITVVPLRDKLLNYARRMTDDPSDAEDAVQEVMLKLWNLRQKLDEYRSIEAVAMTMTHHLCMDMWRAKRPDTLSLDRVQAPTPSATPERLLEEKDEFRLMREIIDSLPTLQRTIIRMKDIEEYETEEIAEITGCNAEAIRSNLSRARKKVREVYLQTIQERTKHERYRNLAKQIFRRRNHLRGRAQTTTFLCRRARTGTSGGISPGVRFLRSGTEGTSGNLRYR